MDETGYMQPTKAELRKYRGVNSIYHNNGIQTWHVHKNGEVENVEVLDAIVPAALIAIGSIAIVLAGSVPPLAAPKSTPAVQPSPAQPSPTPAAAQRLGIGREATAVEIAGWDIDVRPDGQGLPAGKGTVKQGERIV